MITYRSEFHKIIDLTLPTCELGCAEGLFDDEILGWGVPKHYMVDNWATIPNVIGQGAFPQTKHDKCYKEAMARVRKHGDRVHVLKGMTSDMAKFVPDNSLGFLYLDADHNYEGCLNDLITWYPKVVKGGIVGGHDYLSPDYGVNKAVNEFAELMDLKIYTLHENRIEDAGFYFIK